MGRVRILSRLKSILLPSGHKPRRVLGGLNKGIVMNLDLRHDLQRQFGVYEWEIAHLIRRCGGSIRSAIDVGAGDGYYTLYFLMKTSAAVVLAFEPSETSRERILSNLCLNGLEHDARLVLSPQAVGPDNANGSVSLDSIANAVQTPCLVKVDVEGSEAAVLEGAPALLADHLVSWLIETHSSQLERQCADLLGDAGHQTVIVPNAWWRAVMPERRLLVHNRWLYARKVEAVRRSLGTTSDG